MIAEIQSEVFSQRYREKSTHSNRSKLPQLPTKRFEGSSDSNELEKTVQFSKEHIWAAAVPVARESEFEASSDLKPLMNSCEVQCEPINESELSDAIFMGN
jgi:hypothetical protein